MNELPTTPDKARLMTQDELKSDLAAAIKQLAEQSREAIVDCVMERLRSLNLLVPEGWQAVPKEPTEEMFDAGSDHNPTRWTAHTDRGFPREVAHMVFSSMLVAAPKPGDQT